MFLSNLSVVMMGMSLRATDRERGNLVWDEIASSFLSLKGTSFFEAALAMTDSANFLTGLGVNICFLPTGLSGIVTTNDNPNFSKRAFSTITEYFEDPKKITFINF